MEVVPTVFIWNGEDGDRNGDAVERVPPGISIWDAHSLKLEAARELSEVENDAPEFEEEEEAEAEAEEDVEGALGTMGPLPTLAQACGRRFKPQRREIHRGEPENEWGLLSSSPTMDS